jgi:hypothetical protein
VKKFSRGTSATKLFITAVSVIFDDNILSPSAVLSQQRRSPIVPLQAEISLNLADAAK